MGRTAETNAKKFSDAAAEGQAELNAFQRFVDHHGGYKNVLGTVALLGVGAVGSLYLGNKLLNPETEQDIYQRSGEEEQESGGIGLGLASTGLVAGSLIALGWSHEDAINTASQMSDMEQMETLRRMDEQDIIPDLWDEETKQTFQEPLPDFEVVDAVIDNEVRNRADDDLGYKNKYHSSNR